MANIEPVRIGAQRDPPALVLIYKQDGSKLRKRVMPLRGLITLEPGAATRKMVEAHRPFLDLDRISSTQLTEIVTTLVTDAAALPTAPPPAPSAARPPPANEVAMPLTPIAAPPDPNIQPSEAPGVTKKSPTQGHLQMPSHKAAFQQKREAFERGLAPVAAPPLPVAPIAAPPPPSIRIEPAASQHASPLKGVSTSPVELDRGLLQELAGDLDSSGYSSSDEARLKNKSSSGSSSDGAPAGIATTPFAAAPAKTPVGAAPAKTPVPDTDNSLLRSVNFDDLESSTGSVDSLDSLLGSIVSASSPAKAPAIAPAKAAPSKSTAQAAAAPAAAAAAAAAPAPAASTPAAATPAPTPVPAAPPMPLPRQLAPVGLPPVGLPPVGLAPVGLGTSGAGLGGKPLAPLGGGAKQLGGGLVPQGGCSGGLGATGGSGSSISDGGSLRSKPPSAVVKPDAPDAPAAPAAPALPPSVRPPSGAPPRSGSAAPTGADEAFDVSDDDFNDHDLDDLDALSMDGDECAGSGGRRGADDLDGDFDEPSPEKAPSAPKSPSWKAPTAASLLSDDDDGSGSDSDDGEERLLGKGTAKMLSGLLDSRTAAKPTFGAPFRPSALGALGALGGRPPLGGALGGPALKPLGAALGGAGSSLAPLGAGRWK